MGVAAMPNLTPHELRVIGARAGVDPRTAKGILLGNDKQKRKARSTTRARVEETARELGYIPRKPSGR
jgi:DNA-binding LacI/PurR family transcriptional regulator